MTPKVERPPLLADERTAVVGWLDLQRQVVRSKCEGLGEEDAHRAPIPSSPAMTMAGILSHLRWVEHLWLEVMFLGGDEKPNPSFATSVEDADWDTGGRTLAELLAEYEAQCARSNEITAAASLDDVGRNTDYRVGGANLLDSGASHRGDRAPRRARGHRPRAARRCQGLLLSTAGGGGRAG